MISTYLPRTLDYFPKTRRGHGSTHPQPRYAKDGSMAVTRAANPCVAESCKLRRRQDEGKAKRGEAHEDQYANVADWKAEHGFG